jgi:hypothetical protein
MGVGVGMGAGVRLACAKVGVATTAAGVVVGVGAGVSAGSGVLASDVSHATTSKAATSATAGRRVKTSFPIVGTPRHDDRC